MTYYQTDFVRVDWDEECQFVCISWNDNAKSAEFRTAINKSLELVNDLSAYKYISDNSKLFEIENYDVIWLNEEWFPKLIKSEVRYLAVVMPEDNEVQKNLAENISKIGNLEIRSFKSKILAIEWLNKK